MVSCHVQTDSGKYDSGRKSAFKTNAGQVSGDMSLLTLASQAKKVDRLKRDDPSNRHYLSKSGRKYKMWY